MRHLFQIFLYLFVTIFIVALLEPFLSFDFLGSHFGIQKYIIWILFLISLVLGILIIVGSNGAKLLKGKHRLTRKSHQFSLSLSIAIILNFVVTGDQTTSEDVNMFSILFGISIIYMYILFFLVLEDIEQTLEKTEGNKVKTILYDDDPIHDKENDMFKSSDFAEHIAKQLLNLDDKIVIGLYGRWGSGKSSIVNLIEENFPSEQAVINFKPWYFGENNHDIIPSFIKMLAEELDKHHTFQYELKKLLVDYANGLSRISIRSNGMLFKIGDIFYKYFEYQENLTDIKERIAAILTKSNKNIVVFIDEIDRLSPKEVQTLFKLIRLVCDFPKVIYVLALDEEIVCKSLGMLYVSDTEDEDKVKAVGREYLEKFIQVPIYLPTIDPLPVKEFVLTEIEAILVENEIKSDFIKDNRSTIYPLLSTENWSGTMRNYKRYINLVRFFVPFLKEEIFTDDLLYLLFFKVFEPQLYEYIRENPSVFLKEEKHVDKEISDFLSRFKHVEKIIVHLFPYASAYFGSSSRPRGINIELTNGHILVSNPRYFSKYFMYRTPHLEISEKDMARLREVIKQGNLDESIPLLKTFEDVFGIHKVLRKISNDAPTLSYDDIDSITKVLKERYNQLDQYQKRSEITSTLFEIYRGKKEKFLKSVLMNESPIPLFLTLSIGDLLAKHSIEHEEINKELNRILSFEFRNYSLEFIFSNHTVQERQWIFMKWISHEEDTSLKQTKISQYVRDIHQFREVVEYILTDYYQAEPYLMVLIMLENVGINLTRKFLLEYEDIDSDFELKKEFSLLKERFEKAPAYLEYELSSALEKSKKGNFPVKMNKTIERLIEILQDDENSKVEMQSINRLLKEIEEFNKSC